MPLRWKTSGLLGSRRANATPRHKTANVLNTLPKGVQAKAKAMLHDIWMAETQKSAEQAFDLFVTTFTAKFPAATTCLAKDRGGRLTFYTFPAEHWMHIRTTNPIESTFATVRVRTKKTKGAGSRLACLTMVFKLALAAQKQRAVSTSVRQPVSEFTEAPPRARSGKGPGRREAVAVCL